MLRRTELWVLFVGTGALVALVVPWATLAVLLVFDRTEAYSALLVSPRVRLIALHPLRGIVAVALLALSLRALFTSAPRRLWIVGLFLTAIALHAARLAFHIGPAKVTPDVVPALAGYVLLAAYFVPRLLGWKGMFGGADDPPQVAPDSKPP